jgi:hypothetical protein
MDLEAIKDIREELKVIRESQIRTEADLSYHIKRTDSLEKLLNIHESKIEQQIEGMDSKISKVEIPYKVSLFILSALGLIAIVAEILSLSKH